MMRRARNIVLVLCVLGGPGCAADAPANDSTEAPGSGGQIWGAGGAAWGGGPGGAPAAAGAAAASGGALAGAGGDVCFRAPLSPRPGNLFVMVDQSTAMSAPDGAGGTRWSAVASALTEFASSTAGAGVGLGVQYFGLGEGGELFASCNPDDYAQAEVAIAALPGNGGALAESLGRHGPSARLPSVPALQGAIRYARSWRTANADASLGVVLVTGAVPDVCVLPGSTGGTDLVGDLVTVAADGASGVPVVPVHLIGVAPGLEALSPVAPASGGTTHLPLTADLKGHVLSALGSIARGVADPCTFEIPPLPAGSNFDPTGLGLHFTHPDGSPGNEIRPVRDAAACDGSLQFFTDDPASPRSISLCETACRIARTGTSVSMFVACVRAPVG